MAQCTQADSWGKLWHSGQRSTLTVHTDRQLRSVATCCTAATPKVHDGVIYGTVVLTMFHWEMVWDYLWLERQHNYLVQLNCYNSVLFIWKLYSSTLMKALSFMSSTSDLTSFPDVSLKQFKCLLKYILTCSTFCLVSVGGESSMNRMISMCVNFLGGSQDNSDCFVLHRVKFEQLGLSATLLWGQVYSQQHGVPPSGTFTLSYRSPQSGTFTPSYRLH